MNFQGLNGMKVAVFGGTFDPVHNGHVGMARYLLSSATVDKVCFLPAYLPPHKAGKKRITAYEHRRNMLNLILEDRMEVSDLEQQRGGISYTFDTLTYLTQERPEDEFFWNSVAVIECPVTEDLLLLDFVDDNSGEGVALPRVLTAGELTEKMLAEQVSDEYHIGFAIENVYVVFDGEGQLASIHRYYVTWQ